MKNQSTNSIIKNHLTPFQTLCWIAFGSIDVPEKTGGPYYVPPWVDEVSMPQSFYQLSIEHGLLFEKAIEEFHLELEKDPIPAFYISQQDIDTDDCLNIYKQEVIPEAVSGGYYDFKLNSLKSKSGFFSDVSFREEDVYARWPTKKEYRYTIKNVSDLFRESWPVEFGFSREAMKLLDRLIFDFRNISSGMKEIEVANVSAPPSDDQNKKIVKMKILLSELQVLFKDETLQQDPHFSAIFQRILPQYFSSPYIWRSVFEEDLPDLKKYSEPSIDKTLDSEGIDIFERLNQKSNVDYACRHYHKILPCFFADLKGHLSTHLEHKKPNKGGPRKKHYSREWLVSFAIKFCKEHSNVKIVSTDTSEFVRFCCELFEALGQDISGLEVFIASNITELKKRG